MKPRKSFQVLRNSGILQDFQSVGAGMLQKLLLSFLEILKFLRTQFSVLDRGCEDIFCNSSLEAILKQRYNSDFRMGHYTNNSGEGAVQLLCSFTMSLCALKV